MSGELEQQVAAVIYRQDSGLVRYGERKAREVIALVVDDIAAKIEAERLEGGLNGDDHHNEAIRIAARIARSVASPVLSKEQE